MQSPATVKLSDFANVSINEPQPDEHASLSCTLSTVLIFDFDAFHILSADIENTVYIRAQRMLQHNNAHTVSTSPSSSINADLIKASPYPVEHE